MKSLGFIFSCGLRPEPITLGDRVVSRHTTKVKRLYHKHCWDNRSATDTKPLKLTRNREVFPTPRYSRGQPASHTRLVKGVYSTNPGELLCPTLIQWGKCFKYDRNWRVKRSQLLLKHHADSSLELWECEDCKDFLIKVHAQALI